MIVVIVFMVIFPSILLPLGLFFPFQTQISLAFIFCTIFSLICGALGVMAAELKRKLGPYSKNGLPLCLTMIWSFVVLPFGALIPATTVLTQNMEGSQATLLTIGLLIMVALLVLGTSILSVLLNEVFKRLEYEHKAKLAVVRLYESLKTIGVKGEPMPLRICVDQYLWKGKQELSKRLLAQDLVKTWELPPEDPDFTVSKVILTKELYEKAAKKSQENQKKADYREVKLEQKFRKALENKKIEKELEKKRLERRKEQAKRKAEKLERLQAKQAKIKEKLGMSQPIEMSDVHLKINKEDEDQKEEEKEPQDQKYYLSVRPQLSSENLISPRGAFASSAYSNLVSKAEWIGEEAQEGIQEKEETKKRNRSQNYKIVSSKASTQEERLIALFELISERSTRHTVEQLLWISEDAQIRLKNEVFMYFSRDEVILERKDLETLLEICEVKQANLDYFLSEGEHKIEYKKFDRIIHRLGIMEYPAYSKSLSSCQFLIGVVYRRMAYFQSDFASQGFAMYLLDAIRREVEKIREKRIREMLQEEQNQDPDSDQNQSLAQEKPKQNRCKKCLMCPKYVLQWMMLKMALCCFIGAKTKHQELDSQEFSQDISEQELDRLRPSKRKKQEVYEHRPSPEWKQISQHIIQETQASLDLYDPKRGIAWRCVTPNVVMLFIKLMEFFSFLSFIWSSDIPWNFSEQTTAALVSVNGDTPQSYSLYLYFYGISLLLAILYTFLVRPAAIKARNGTLGMNKDGLPAKLCTRPFLFSKLVQFMSASFYTFILKNLLDAFSCNFSNSSEVVLLREESVQCFEAAHFALMGGALIGLLAYYPFATFLYANLQFINKDTDLKYHPQFMVYLAQAKLIFSSLASFLHSSDTSLIIRITLMAATALFLGIKSALSEPCLVKSANIFHTAGYLSISHLILMTSLVVLKVNSFVVLALMGGGVFIIWLVTIVLSCIARRKSHKVPVQREEVAQD